VSGTPALEGPKLGFPGDGVLGTLAYAGRWCQEEEATLRWRVRDAGARRKGLTLCRKERRGFGASITRLFVNQNYKLR
jgi:hypothetical protein